MWDIIRRHVDRDPRPGQFILTGSATPSSEASAHSGAGRVVQVRMRPLGLFERGLSEPTVSLRALLAGDRSAVDGQSTLTLPDYVDEILASGFPAIRALNGRRHCEHG